MGRAFRFNFVSISFLFRFNPQITTRGPQSAIRGIAFTRFLPPFLFLLLSYFLTFFSFHSHSSSLAILSTILSPSRWEYARARAETDLGLIPMCRSLAYRNVLRIVSPVACRVKCSHKLDSLTITCRGIQGNMINRAVRELRRLFRC